MEKERTETVCGAARAHVDDFSSVGLSLGSDGDFL